MTRSVGYHREGALGIITVDNPPVNALSQAVRQGLLAAVRAGEADSRAKALVLICAGRTFIAGADIREFGAPAQSPDISEVFDALENTSKPLVAAIHGTALGGGLETALVCHYRCALPSARVGLPEVTLGLLPGAGGTQRLPRVAGVKAALDLMITGAPIDARLAKERGIIDHIVEGDLLEGACAYARQLADEKAPLRKIRDIDIDGADIAQGFFDDYRRAIAPRTRGLFAPERIIQCVENATRLPFEKGLEEERRLFIDCMASPQSAALRHVFFAERQTAHIPDIAPDIAKDTGRRAISKVAIIGAGTMGSGIAMNFLNAGLPVRLLETRQDALDRGLGVIEKTYARQARKGRISKADMARNMSLLSGTLDYAGLADVDLVIEAVFENMAIKKQVFAKLDGICKKGAILATNTSTLDVNEIARATSRPQDVIGLHFFSPANVMRLLEIVRGEKTAKDVVATCMAMARSIGKVGVLSGVCYGFIGNRMLEGYLREASFLLLEGAAPEQIDKALYDFGMAMGPHAMGDLAGIDVGCQVREERRAAGALPDDPRYGLIADKLAELGRYGQKTGAGIYRYEKGSRTPIPDPQVQELIENEAKRLGIERRDIADDEIIKRCLYPLINEGARILEEGIALRPGDIDIVWINGYGFPAHRGGPMFYADQIGLDAVYQTICACQSLPGDYWTPAPLLERLALDGKSFSDL
jgi:3-hydroxyacyl-CoA dehydrogenase